MNMSKEMLPIFSALIGQDVSTPLLPAFHQQVDALPSQCVPWLPCANAQVARFYRKPSLIECIASFVGNCHTIRDAINGATELVGKADTVSKEAAPEAALQQFKYSLESCVQEYVTKTREVRVARRLHSSLLLEWLSAGGRSATGERSRAVTHC